MNPAGAPDIIIHLPSRIDWWPPAPGWWLLLITLVILIPIAFIGIRRWLNWRKPRFEALAKLEKIHQAYLNNHDQQQFMQAVSRLLRQVAITYYGRDKISGLTGDTWLAFLNQQQTHVTFTHDLAELPYQKQPLSTDIQALLNQVKQWISSAQRHKQC